MLDNLPATSAPARTRLIVFRDQVSGVNAKKRQAEPLAEFVLLFVARALLSVGERQPKHKMLSGNRDTGFRVGSADLYDGPPLIVVSRHDDLDQGQISGSFLRNDSPEPTG
jgi:hypothetical protein